MRNASTRRRGLAAVAAILVLLAGCATQAPVAAPDREPVALEPATPAARVQAAEPEPPARATPSTRRAEIAVVLDERSPAHSAVAEEIEAALSPRRYRVTRFTSADDAALAALRNTEVTVVAVGDGAVRAARTALPTRPLVFCQVPDHDEALRAGGPVWGVQSLPPLAMQLKHWRAIDPTLRTIALIVSTSRATLAAEAQAAASTLATDLLVETSASDRETLYLFRRLATGVDGLWLLPDNDALSPLVLREILSYASSRGIGVLAFNEALLARGALMSATAVPADVAATVSRVVEQVVSGRTAELSKMTPLSAAELAVNAGVASTLGLPPVIAERWVAREHD